MSSDHLAGSGSEWTFLVTWSHKLGDLAETISLWHSRSLLEGLHATHVLAFEASTSGTHELSLTSRLSHLLWLTRSRVLLSGKLHRVADLRDHVWHRRVLLDGHEL